MRRHFAALPLGLMLLPGVALAERVVAHVSIAGQEMKVCHEGRASLHLSRDHRSRRCNNAPMPFAIVHDGNHAIHGTGQSKRLGKPASHGCVRLDPKNAKILFEMVKAEGKETTRVVIVQQSRPLPFRPSTVYSAGLERFGSRRCRARPTST